MAVIVQAPRLTQYACNLPPDASLKSLKSVPARPVRVRFVRLTFCHRGRTCLVNPLTVKPAVNPPAGAGSYIVHTLPLPLVSDADCNPEAIDLRANHVGPVLEKIMADMEKNWLENSELDLEP